MSKFDFAGGKVYVNGVPSGTAVSGVGTYGPGGLLPKGSSAVAVSAHDIMVARETLYTYHVFLEDMSDDISGRIQSLASVYRIGDTSMYRIASTELDFCIAPLSSGGSPAYHMAAARTEDVLKAMVEKLPKLAHSQAKGDRALLALTDAMREAASSAAGESVNRIISLGAESPLIADHLRSEARWTSVVSSLSFNVAPGIEIVLLTPKFKEDKELPTIDVWLRWRMRGDGVNIMYREAIHFKPGATYTLHDFLLEMLNSGSVPSPTLRCQLCGEDGLRDHYLKFIEEVTTSNILMPILIREGGTCPGCIHKKVAESRAAEEYLRKGAVPEF